MREAQLTGPTEDVDLDAMASGKSSPPPGASTETKEKKAATPPPPEEKPDEADDYMGRLLKAKRKSKDKSD